MREKQLAREIGRKFAELGFGTVQTEEEYEKSKKNFKKIEKREKSFSSVFSGSRTIIYTPLPAYRRCDRQGLVSDIRKTAKADTGTASTREGSDRCLRGLFQGRFG